MLRKTSLWLISLCYLFIVQPVNALEVEVSVDRNPVIVNESFNLTITANDDLPRWAFNSRALLQDFVVGSTSIDSSSMTSQGVTERTTRWTVRLTAREPGTYTIPSFDIEGTRTTPLEVEVIEAQRDNDGENRPFFIEAKVDKEAPYVQQQVRYTVDLYIHAEIPLESGSIAPPLADNAEIEQITQNRERQEIINGQRYQVVTQVYSITPQRSGPLEIQGAQFEGLYRQLNPRSFSGFARPEQVSLMTPTQTLNVKPAPADFSDTWFVSEQVAIERSISPASGLVAQGEPIIETVKITAEGVRPEQIPELNLTTPGGIRSYPERPQKEVFARGDTRIGQVVYTTVYIPGTDGSFTLPELRLPWFNPTRERVEVARAAPVTFTITPADNSQTMVRNEPQIEEDDSTAIATNAANSTEQSSASTPSLSSTTVNGVPVPWFLGLIALWLLTMGSGFIYIRHLRTRKEQKPATVPEAARASLNSLKQACMANNASEILIQIVAWQRARSPEQGTLGKFKDAFNKDTALMKELSYVESALYSAEKQPYQRGKEFWKAFSKRHKKTHHEKPQSLYP
ncbi:MAG: oxygen tolerance locus protein BatD [Idiomarinaceae bacterium HL-53]|nr:MAG: oxygen tolerance locus protein BatD [Idiomarinaceae bacterium HL-53]CUS49372.1 Oxygen tolerance [Idiomarinaceae bacterium HL-53]